MIKKILITGGTGMVGQGFTRIKSDHKLILVGSKDYDLTSSHMTSKMLIDHKDNIYSVRHSKSKE